ncbi:kinesin, putative [Coccidioides posadasii C735 delta SOWgp]|uniref:Kinesin-like protein n=1 Tax=Coccidioides posadasii (strain C735) TaxID=222929 RepID=C5PDA8_COCP7|nr:kinesin, putative [Coccidioides posadasii C735 delta SOWgp]EER25069.1 kinesin, putative [Coccidioides posadasii C735 delta SOWgp]|eukprot:XP_003067214.1 kinesin, putative [Coccidioides posadasii C735 delta SOWgp]
MFYNYLCRHRDIALQLDWMLKNTKNMSLDPRFYNSIAHLPPRPSLSHSSSNYPPEYGSFTPSMASFTSASVAGVRSTASSPSLRSKERIIAPATRPGTPMNGGGGGGNVKVVVRVRGFLPREIQRGAHCLVHMNPATQSTTLLAPSGAQGQTSKVQSRSKVVEDKTFTFDNSFWSHDEDDPHYATQEDVYNCLGEEFLDHNFEGYHTCIFAYGQTGSGKSYTMMGTPENPGLIPRTCEDLFQRIENSQSPDVTYHVRVSYFEVYNEHVRDLLVPRTDTPYYLKIRESPTDGPYVKDLTDVPVRNFAEVLRYMRKGDASRTTASTKMNDTSSRSHAVFTIMLKQIHHDLTTDETIERTARIRLVDLAGSERAKATEATGQRLREGSNINKSLTTLGRVIAALADNRPGRARKNKDIVPYRDSILTWLLKDSLGGNSKTAMIACIAPSDYEETLSTLRYADQAKRIRTRAVINQDHVSAAERDAQIAEMAETIRTLQLSVSQQAVSKRDMEMQNEKLEEYQKQVTKLQRLMEETKMVSENKIRQLQTENEALRLHLRLALDSLKNPIPPVEVIKRRNRNSSPALASAKEEVKSEKDRDKENTAPQEPPDLIWEDSISELDVEVQAEMEDLLSDLSFFRRKLADDCERFGVKRRSRGDRKTLSEVSMNR